MSPSLSLLALLLAVQEAPRLGRGSALEAESGPGQEHRFLLPLRRGESAELSVMQQGIDLAVDVLDPQGRLIDSVDSPNGRQGEEPVSVVAGRAGTYVIRVRPLSPDEPAGRFTLRVTALRSAAATRALAEQRQRVRSEATRWLASRSAPLPAQPWSEAELAPFDRLAREARVIGLGEASHGSREFGDVRVGLIRRLVELHGYRLIALEDSARGWRELAPYVEGTAASPPAPLDLGWIGGRSRRELLLWVRGWNLAHPSDRVRIVGVDPQDVIPGTQLLSRFLEMAYGAQVVAAWAPVGAEIAAASEQTQVFGDSGINAATRAAMLEVRSRLETDAPLLRSRFGAAEVDRVLAAARDMVQFVDFNAGSGLISHSRDWYMAVNLLTAMEGPGAAPKAIYWGHNSHVSAAQTRWGPTGAVLRQALGCGYRAIALTFGRGSFIAQVPNDPRDRLAATTLAEPAEETIENVLAGIGPGNRIASWNCGSQAEAPPAWLQQPRPMRWIGGLFAPDTPASATYRPYQLTAAFDGIVYLPSVTAEAIPADRPIVPARRRDPEPRR